MVIKTVIQLKNKEQIYKEFLSREDYQRFLNGIEIGFKILRCSIEE